MAKENDETIEIIGAAIGSALFILLVILLIERRSKASKVKQNSRILFIGDSTTANSNGYVEKLGRMYPALTIKKIAVSGQQTGSMLSQLQGELATGAKYDIISILGGSNDIFATTRIDKAEQNLQAMYDLAHQNGAKVVAISPPNKSFYPLATAKHFALIKDYDNWIRNNKSVNFFVDLNNLVNTQDLFTQDMEHINGAGHDILAQAFAQTVIQK